MHQLFRSIAAGVLSGVLTCTASIYALGFTNALVLPQGFPLALWEAVVVFGMGAMLVAALLHFLAVRLLAAKALPVFAAFALSAVAALAASGLLAHGGKALVAWLIGALLASGIHNRLWPKSLPRPMPLRSSA